MTLDDIADLAETAGCDVSALDGRDYQWLCCDSQKLEELVRLIENATLERAALKCMILCRVIEEPHEFERCAEAIRGMKT